jgi:hypothetical protein
VDDVAIDGDSPLRASGLRDPNGASDRRLRDRNRSATADIIGKLDLFGPLAHSVIVSDLALLRNIES